MSTREDSRISTAPNGTTPCDCEGCRTSDLPVNPFVALRVAYGMLLGEEDFRALMGNPRGKQMLHSAWLHGSGVVWGYDVVVDGVWMLKIGQGLALDGVGRELRNETTACLDVRGFVEELDKSGQLDKDQTIRACLVAEFDSCLSNPVPTLADPCDVTRKHDDYSRILERVRFSLVCEECCPKSLRPYHRVRLLLGLDSVEPGSPDPLDPTGEATKALHAVAAAGPNDRAQELVKQFRKLAALDSIDLSPAKETGDCYPTLFPLGEEHVAVVLAGVEIGVRRRNDILEIGNVGVDQKIRTALLPTATIQELTCGLAPALIGDEGEVDAGGPRVKGELIALAKDDQQLIIPVTEPLAEGSVPGTVKITSLPTGKTSGWVMEDIDNVRYDEGQGAIVVDLADPPVHDLIRIVVTGTGPKPLMGRAPVVPLAGLVGGPPGTRHEGHDAVWTLHKTMASQGGAGSSEAASQGDTDEGKEASR